MSAVKINAVVKTSTCFPGSPWKDQISLAILDLQEKGEMQMLYNKWWKPPNDMCLPEESGANAKTNTLDFKNICKYVYLIFRYFEILIKYLCSYMLLCVFFFVRWSICCAIGGTYHIDFSIFVRVLLL